ADRDRRRPRLRHRRQPLPLRPARLRPGCGEAALVPLARGRLLHRRQRRSRRGGDRRPGIADARTTIAAMPSLPNFKLLGAVVAATALLALPAAAEATLVYVKNPSHPAVFAANDNGGGAFKVGPG